MSFRLFLNYWILKWLSCLKLPLSKLYSIFSRFLLESYYLVHKPLMTVMLIKLKLLNVEFKALHVITPVHHSRQSRKKKIFQLCTSQATSFHITPPKLLPLTVIQLFFACHTILRPHAIFLPLCLITKETIPTLSLVSNHLLKDIVTWLVFTSPKDIR